MATVGLGPAANPANPTRLDKSGQIDLAGHCCGVVRLRKSCCCSETVSGVGGSPRDNPRDVGTTGPPHAAGVSAVVMCVQEPMNTGHTGHFPRVPHQPGNLPRAFLPPAPHSGRALGWLGPTPPLVQIWKSEKLRTDT